jgi:phage/plasmid-associated DNA primase
MATTKTESQLVVESETLALSFEYVHFNGVLYAPVDYETGEDAVLPSDDRKSWRPMDTRRIQLKARAQFDTLFGKDDQLKNFIYKVKQAAIQVEEMPESLLVKTSTGLKVLKGDGKLHDPDGSFVPNTLAPVLNENKADKEELLAIITDWLGGEEEEAISLLRHLSTALAPHWSAGKYILLIGNGRNGKSVLTSMMQELFSTDNCSSITRQMIGESNPAMHMLNGKLLNLVFDGPATWIKDSGNEKSLITGEPVLLRKLYDNDGTVVRTNALFIESLNKEPKSSDKSSALQERLVRFWLPNRYPDNLGFLAKMKSERMLGALLSLLIDHYVLKDEVAVMLAPTKRAMELKLEHMEDNSLALQFLLHVDQTDPFGAESVFDMTFDEVVSKFASWRISLGDLSVWDKNAVLDEFRPICFTDRKSQRVNGKPRHVRYITAFTKETRDLLDNMREDAHATAVVDD